MKNAPENFTKAAQTRAISAKAMVGHAGECIRQAMDTFNAADLSRVASSQELLERAVNDLKQASGALGQNPPRNLKELHPLVAALKKDVNRMSQVVDACAAFQRGLAARLGDPGVAYDASGAPRQTGSEAACSIEV
jgi:hypothetical protein